MRSLFAMMFSAMLCWSSMAVRPAAQPISRTVVVTLCDLLQHPYEFENQVVHVEGTVQAGPEFLGLVGGPCSPGEVIESAIWLDAAAREDFQSYARGWSMERFIQAIESGELKGGAPSVQWQKPVPVSTPDPEQVERLNRALRESEGHRVTVIITGRFEYAADGLLIKDAQGRYFIQRGFGHLNSCPSRIAYESIEVVNRLTTP